ncbi:hypothetical protein B4077_5587 [Bacillus cereus]|uniref:Uncharacterized protein n=1 Tax=Bacillus cereus TaxID=1396 RepID=A0A0G8EW42_BACCE|nr:hypothetical protein B4077_5587 [Bacillus cereus]
MITIPTPIAKICAINALKVSLSTNINKHNVLKANTIKFTVRNLKNIDVLLLLGLNTQFLFQ